MEIFQNIITASWVLLAITVVLMVVYVKVKAPHISILEVIAGSNKFVVFTEVWFAVNVILDVVYKFVY